MNIFKKIKTTIYPVDLSIQSEILKLYSKELDKAVVKIGKAISDILPIIIEYSDALVIEVDDCTVEIKLRCNDKRRNGVA